MGLTCDRLVSVGVSHFGIAALTAAVSGALFASLVAAVTLANRRLADPYDADERGALVVAASGLLSGALFAILGADTVGAWLSLAPWVAVPASLAGTAVLSLLGTIALRPLAYRYLRWARPPSLLREEREDGFEP